MQVKFYYKKGVKPLQYQTNGSSGVDLAANEDITLLSNSVGVIATGVFVIIPYQYEGQVRSRSGLACKGIFVANSPGTIDCVPKGTKIATLDGNKLVEDIFLSEDVETIISYNEEFDKIEEDYVTDCWIVKDLNLLQIVTEKGDCLSLPETKFVYTKCGWVMAKELSEASEILSLD